ncbi:MAG: hypothetical protein MIO92_11205 [Methanosarcinaceae archaeon]|nr:hypothetical protein [Methanosarcinaceae archaeon]
MLLQYRGKSFFPSKIIVWFTWSKNKYSHSAWSFCEVDGGRLVGDTSEFEAWAGKGVVHVPRIGANHTPGTRIDIYELQPVMDNVAASAGLKFLSEQIGKNYDYRGIFGFLLRKRNFHNPNAWFCSELIFSFLQKCGRYLLNEIEAYQVSPQMLPMCPQFEYKGYILAGGDLIIRKDSSPMAK